MSVAEIGSRTLVDRERDGMYLPKITKFEFAALLGMLIEQLARGMPPTIEINTNNPEIIAREMIKHKQCPYYIIRMIDGQPCKVDVNKLIITKDMLQMANMD